MIRGPPGSTRTGTPFPSPTLFLSGAAWAAGSLWLPVPKTGPVVPDGWSLAPALLLGPALSLGPMTCTCRFGVSADLLCDGCGCRSDDSGRFCRYCSTTRGLGYCCFTAPV